jgi:hypothetical protein
MGHFADAGVAGFDQQLRNGVLLRPVDRVMAWDRLPPAKQIWTKVF